MHLYVTIDNINLIKFQSSKDEQELLQEILNEKEDDKIIEDIAQALSPALSKEVTLELFTDSDAIFRTLHLN
jgi:hypothetical protein